MTIGEREREVARALLEINAVGFTPDNPITFKSGIVSPVYVNNRILPDHPDQWSVIIERFKEVIIENDLKFDTVAGVAVGAVPHSAALGYALHKPSVYVRPEAKDHGVQKKIDSGVVDGKKVLLIEDHVTTAGSSLEAVKTLRGEGAVVDYVMVITSYDFVEATAAFQEEGIELLSLTTFSAILEEAETMGKLDEKNKAVVADWLTDPRGWAGRRGL